MVDPSPIRPADAEAKDTARALLAAARHAALGVLDPASRAPMLSRIALARAPDGRPMSLISSLAAHTAALAEDPRCSLLVGEPGAKGDPLTHPRLTIQARAAIVPRESDAHAGLRAHYLAARPRAALYADFTDFAFVVFDVDTAFLNAGFGKAFTLAAADLAG